MKKVKHGNSSSKATGQTSLFSFFKKPDIAVSSSAAPPALLHDSSSSLGDSTLKETCPENFKRKNSPVAAQKGTIIVSKTQIRAAPKKVEEERDDEAEASLDENSSSSEDNKEGDDDFVLETSDEEDSAEEQSADDELVDSDEDEDKRLKIESSGSNKKRKNHPRSSVGANASRRAGRLRRVGCPAKSRTNRSSVVSDPDEDQEEEEEGAAEEKVIDGQSAGEEASLAEEEDKSIADTESIADSDDEVRTKSKQRQRAATKRRRLLRDNDHEQQEQQELLKERRKVYGKGALGRQSTTPVSGRKVAALQGKEKESGAHGHTHTASVCSSSRKGSESAAATSLAHLYSSNSQATPMIDGRQPCPLTETGDAEQTNNCSATASSTASAIKPSPFRTSALFTKATGFGDSLSQTPPAARARAVVGAADGGAVLHAVPLPEGVIGRGSHEHNSFDFLQPEHRRDKAGHRPGHPLYNPRTLHVPDAFLKSQTPALVQWWEFKSQNMDIVLFFKVGKFYELFHMDADIGYSEIDLIYMKGPRAHSGFPEIAYGKFANALVDKGYRVARVEQTETPDMLKERNDNAKRANSKAKASKVVARELCSVMSKGTRTYCHLDDLSLLQQEGDAAMGGDTAAGTNGRSTSMLVCITEIPPPASLFAHTATAAAATSATDGGGIHKDTQNGVTDMDVVMEGEPKKYRRDAKMEGEEEKEGDDGRVEGEDVTEYGVCCIDTELGAITLAQFQDDPQRTRLRTMLSRYVPTEVLLREPVLPSSLQAAATATATIAHDKKTLGVVQLISPRTAIERLRREELPSAQGTFSMLVQGKYYPSASNHCTNKKNKNNNSSNKNQSEGGEELSEEELSEWPVVLQAVIKASLMDGSSDLVLSALGGVLWQLRRSFIDYEMLSMQKVYAYVPPDALNTAAKANGPAFAAAKNNDNTTAFSSAGDCAEGGSDVRVSLVSRHLNTSDGAVVASAFSQETNGGTDTTARAGVEVSEPQREDVLAACVLQQQRNHQQGLGGEAVRGKYGTAVAVCTDEIECTLPDPSATSQQAGYVGEGEGLSAMQGNSQTMHSEKIAHELEAETEQQMQQHMVLDEVALTNLEVLVNNYDRTERGSLWAFLNRAKTPFGRRLLRSWLTHPLFRPRDIRRRKEAVQELMGEPIDTTSAPRGFELQSELASSAIATAAALKVAEAGNKAKRLLCTVPDLERLLTRVHTNGLRTKGTNHPDSRAILYEMSTYTSRKIKDFADVLTGFEVLHRVGKLFEDVPISSRLLAFAMKPDATPPSSFSSSTAIGSGSNNGTSLPLGKFPSHEMGKLLSHFRQIFDEKQSKRDGNIRPRAGVDPEYDAAKADAAGIVARFDAYLREQKRQTGLSELKYFATQKDRYQLEVPIAKCSKVPDDWCSKSQTKAVRRYYTPAIEEMLGDLAEAEQRIDAAQKDTLRRVFERFDASRNVWSVAVSCIALFDALAALAEVSSLPGYVWPVVAHREHGASITATTTTTTVTTANAATTAIATGAAGKSRVYSGPFLRIEGGRHPMLEFSLSQKSGGLAGDFIPNDTELGGLHYSSSSHHQALDRETGTVESGYSYVPRMLLLSGPNMGGKSTLLRQTCLIAILAQLGCKVPADKCEMSPIDRIFTRVGASDRILAGQSTFFVELAETATILANATEDSLCILDELGRGTATFDGTAVAHAVVDHLVQRVRCRTLFATHYHSLVEDWSIDPRVRLGHMDCLVTVDEDSNSEMSEQGEIERTSAAEDGTEKGAAGETGVGKNGRAATAAEEVTFLYKLCEGSSPRSYGINVARLAGLPSAVIQMALEQSARFEEQSSGLSSSAYSFPPLSSSSYSSLLPKKGENGTREAEGEREGRRDVLISIFERLVGIAQFSDNMSASELSFVAAELWRRFAAVQRKL